jgi:hypothetical protein
LGQAEEKYSEGKCSSWKKRTVGSQNRIEWKYMAQERGEARIEEEENLAVKQADNSFEAKMYLELPTYAGSPHP